MKKRLHFPCGIGAHPSDVADLSTLFHLLCSLCHSLLPWLNLSFLLFSPRNWALNSISWIDSFSTSPFLPSLDLCSSGISLSSWAKEALGGLGKGQMQLWFSPLRGKHSVFGDVYSSLPWLQHCGGRAEVKNQNPCCALACLNTVQEVWIAWSWGPCCCLLTEALC